MRFGSVCSGIEAASVAWEPLGWKAAWFSEIEPFPSAVLAHHYPDVPNLGDMTTLPARIRSGEVEAPDLFCGGTPCQAFSVAGLRKSLDDARGNLSLTFVEIADAIDHVRRAGGKPPAIVFWENVPGVLSTADNAFGCFLGALAGCDSAIEPLAATGWTDAGVVAGPERTVAWRILDAQFFGLAQRRRRVFVVASAGDGFDPAAVLLEFDGVRRDSAPSREAGQRVAPTVMAGAPNGGPGHGARSGHTKDNLIVPVAFGGGQNCAQTDVSTALHAHPGGSRLDFQTETFIAHTLRREGFDASEDGTGRGTPLVPVAYSIMPMNSGKDYKARKVDVAQPLMAGGPVGGNQGGDFIAQPVAIRTAQTSSNGWGINTEGTAYTLDQAQGQAVAFHPTQTPISSTEVCHAIGANENATAAVAFAATAQALTAGYEFDYNDEKKAASHLVGNSKQGCATAAVGFYANEGTHGSGQNVEMSPTLKAHPKTSNLAAVATAMQVRRLTPVECERLQGFPDGYTAIPWRNKPADQCPDGPRYKALGNSWAVPCVRWIGRRINDAL